jgi:hypothetical protein
MNAAGVHAAGTEAGASIVVGLFWRRSLHDQEDSARIAARRGHGCVAVVYRRFKLKLLECFSAPMGHPVQRRLSRHRTFFLMAVFGCTAGGLFFGGETFAQGNNPPSSQSDRNQTSNEEQGKNGAGQTQDKDQNQPSDQDQNAAEITAAPNRPTFSTTAESVQRGVLEIEYGIEAADGHQNVNGLIKFGLFKNLELRFANNLLERDSGLTGVGDSGAGFKYRIRSQAGLLPTFSVLYTAAIPTSTGAPGIGAVDHDVTLLFSKDFGKHHIDINGGVNFLGRPGASGYDRNYFTAFSYAHPLTQKLGFTAEIAGFSRANLSTPATMTLLFAATYNVSSRLVLDGGEYTAVYGNLPRVTGFAGVTYSIANLYHPHGARRTAERKP